MRVKATIQGHVPNSSDPDLVYETYSEQDLEIISNVSGYKDTVVMIRLGPETVLVNKDELRQAVESVCRRET